MKYKIWLWGLIALAIIYQIPSIEVLLNESHLICINNNACLFHKNNIFFTLLFLVPTIFGTLLCIVAAMTINHRRTLSFFCTALALIGPAAVVVFASISLRGFGI